MGAPSSVIDAAYGRIEPKYRTYRATVDAGSGNIILPGPPAGFVRIPSTGGEAGIACYKANGGSCAWDLRHAGNRVGNAEVTSGQFESSMLHILPLAFGQDLTVDITAGTDPDGLEFVTAYQDVPDTDVVVASVLLGTGLTTIIPAPVDSTKAHLMLSVGGFYAFHVWNDSEADAADVIFFVNSNQVDESVNLQVLTDMAPEFLIQGGFAATTEPLRASASVDAIVRVITAYRIVDRASL